MANKNDIFGILSEPEELQAVAWRQRNPMAEMAARLKQDEYRSQLKSKQIEEQNKAAFNAGVAERVYNWDAYQQKFLDDVERRTGVRPDGEVKVKLLDGVYNELKKATGKGDLNTYMSENIIKPSIMAEMQASAAKNQAKADKASGKASEGSTFLGGVGDVALSLGQSVVGLGEIGGRLVGANDFAGGAANVREWLQTNKTDASQAERKKLQEAVAKAEKSGSTKEEVFAYLDMFKAQPLEFIAETIGPTLGIGAVARVGGKVAAKVLGKEAAKTGAIATGATAGAAFGLGEVKGNQYETTYNEAIARGFDEPKAKAMAEAASEYSLKNAGQQALGAGLGAVGVLTGPLDKLIMGTAAKAGAKGLAARAATGIAIEGGTEALQEGQGKYAGNVAAIDAGVLDSSQAFRGVAGSAALGGVVGGTLGGVSGAVSGGASAAPLPDAEFESEPTKSPLTAKQRADIRAMPQEEAFAAYAATTGADLNDPEVNAATLQEFEALRTEPTIDNDVAKTITADAVRGYTKENSPIISLRKLLSTADKATLLDGLTVGEDKDAATISAKVDDALGFIETAASGKGNFSNYTQAEFAEALVENISYLEQVNAAIADDDATKAVTTGKTRTQAAEEVVKANENQLKAVQQTEAQKTATDAKAAAQTKKEQDAAELAGTRFIRGESQADANERLSSYAKESGKSLDEVVKLHAANYIKATGQGAKSKTRDDFAKDTAAVIRGEKPAKPTYEQAREVGLSDRDAGAVAGIRFGKESEAQYNVRAKSALKKYEDAIAKKGSTEKPNPKPVTQEAPTPQKMTTAQLKQELQRLKPNSQKEVNNEDTKPKLEAAKPVATTLPESKQVNANPPSNPNAVIAPSVTPAVSGGVSIPNTDLRNDAGSGATVATSEKVVLDKKESKLTGYLNLLSKLNAGRIKTILGKQFRTKDGIKTRAEIIEGFVNGGAIVKERTYSIPLTPKTRAEVKARYDALFREVTNERDANKKAGLSAERKKLGEQLSSGMKPSLERELIYPNGEKVNNVLAEELKYAEYLTGITQSSVVQPKAEADLAPIPKTSPEILEEQRRLAKVKRKQRMQGMSNALKPLREQSPFLEWLMVNGIAKSEQSEWQDFNPKAAFIGRLFREDGKSIDNLVELAVEDGYLPPNTNDQAGIRELISRQARGESISPLYTEDGATNAVAEAVERQRAEYEDYLAVANESSSKILTDLDFIPDDLEVSGYNDLSRESQAKIQALLATANSLGVDADLILENVQYETTGKPDELYYTEAIKQLTEVITTGNASSSQNVSEQSQAPSQSAEGLTAPIRADVLAQQDRSANATALDAQQQAITENQAQPLVQQTAPDQRTDTTGEMFGLEKAKAELDKANKGKAVEVDPNQDNLFETTSSRSTKGFTDAFGSGVASLVEAKNIAQSIVPSLGAIDVVVSELPIGTIARYDRTKGIIEISNRFNWSQDRLVEALVEERLHALDSISPSKTISQNAATFMPNGEAYLAAEKQVKENGIFGEFLTYPISYKNLSDNRVAAELFARIGVLFASNPRAAALAFPNLKDVYDIQPTENFAVDERIRDQVPESSGVGRGASQNSSQQRLDDLTVSIFGQVGTDGKSTDTIRTARSRQRIVKALNADVKGLNKPQQSQSTPTTNPTTPAAIRKAIEGIFSGMKDAWARISKSTVVVDTVADLPEFAEAIGTKGQAFFVPSKVKGEQGKIYLIADRITKGQEASVWLHEVFHKRGEELLGKDNLKKLYDNVQSWKTRKPDSVERQIYEAAHKRATDSGDYEGEFLTYAIEEASNLGVKPDASKGTITAAGWLAKVKSLFTAALRKLTGVASDINLSANDLMAMAYGAAKLEYEGKTAGAQGDGIQFSRASSIDETLEIIKTGKLPDDKRSYSEIKDSIVTSFTDSTRPHDVWTRDLPDQGDAATLIQAKNLASGREAAFNKEIMDNFGSRISVAIGAIHKANKDIDFDAAQRLAGDWMSAIYAPIANQNLLKKDMQALQEAVDAAKAESTPANKAAVTRAKNTVLKRQTAIVDKRVIDPSKQKLDIGLAGGYNDATAKQMASYIEERIDTELLQNVADIVYEMNAWKLQKDIELGKVTKEMAAQFDQSGKYVPLTGDPRADETASDVFGTGSTNQGKDRAMQGRTSGIAQNGIDASFEQIQKTARYHGWADYKDALHDMYEKSIAKYLADGSTQQEAQKKTTEDLGISRSPETMQRPSDDVIIYRKNGKAWVYDIGNKAAIDALRSANVEPIPTAYRYVALATRAMARLVTQFMPGFAPVNALRDTWEKSENIRTRIAPNYPNMDMNKVARTMLGQSLKSLTTLHKSIMPVVAQGTPVEAIAKLDPNNADQKLMMQFLKDGGASTWGQFLSTDGKDLAEKLGKMHSLPKKAVDTLDVWNNSWELISSFSAYKALRENGMDSKAASNMALELMNFRKGGELMKPIKALYMFAQPIATGGHQLLKTLDTRRGKARFAAYAAAGFLLYAMLRSGEDDDELGINRMDNRPNYETERNIIIPYGDAGKSIAIPIGFGLPMLAWTYATNIAKMTLGKQTAGETAIELVVKTPIKTFAPVAPSESSISKNPFAWMVQTLTPTLGKPIANVALDRTAFGSSLTSSRFEKADKANALEGRMNTPEFYKDAAKELANVGLDTYPEVVREIIHGYFIGALNVVVKAAIDNPAKEARGKEPVSQFIDRWVKNQDRDDLKQRLYYRYREELNDVGVKASLGKALDGKQTAMLKILEETKKDETSVRTSKAQATKKFGNGKNPSIYEAELKRVESKQSDIQVKLIRKMNELDAK